MICANSWMSNNDAGIKVENNDYIQVILNNSNHVLLNCGVVCGNISITVGSYQ